MPTYTIETTYHLPVYRHRTYRARSLDAACRRAVADDDWSGQKEDHDCCSEALVTGIWRGADKAYAGEAIPIPTEFNAEAERKADHFETLLGLLKILIGDQRAGRATCEDWLSRADLAVEKAHAILAGEPEPTATAPRLYVLAVLDEARVCKQVTDLLATDDSFSPLKGPDIRSSDIVASCATVAATADLTEEIGAAEFRAARAAVQVSRRQIEGRAA